jgi:hypothetical protein
MKLIQLNLSQFDSSQVILLNYIQIDWHWLESTGINLDKLGLTLIDSNRLILTKIDSTISSNKLKQIKIRLELTQIDFKWLKLVQIAESDQIKWDWIEENGIDVKLN